MISKCSDCGQLFEGGAAKCKKCYYRLSRIADAILKQSGVTETEIGV